jgi:hypothetical protein
MRTVVAGIFRVKMFCKIFERVCREPLGETLFENYGGKKVLRGKVNKEPMDGVAIFLNSVENLSDVLGL